MIYYHILDSPNNSRVLALTSTTNPQPGKKYYTEEGLYRLINSLIEKIEKLQDLLIEGQYYAFTREKISYPLHENPWFKECKDTITIDPRGIEIGNKESLQYILDTKNIVRTLDFKYIDRVSTISGMKNIYEISKPSDLQNKYINWEAKNIVDFINWKKLYSEHNGFLLSQKIEYPLEEFTYEEYLHIVKIVNSQFQKHNFQLRERYRNVYLSMALVGIIPYTIYYWDKVYSKIEIKWTSNQWIYLDTNPIENDNSATTRNLPSFT